MNEEQFKELETQLIEISKICEKLPERYRDASFELLSKKIIVKSSKNDISDSQEYDSNDEDPLSKLATLCDVSSHDLQNVISTDGENLILLCSLTGSDSNRQTIGSMIILLCYNVLFSEIWVSSIKILEILKKLGIEDKGGNFATNLKKKTNLILKKPGSNEYMLTTSDGLKVAKNLLKKLSKLETITKNDLIID